MLAGTINFSCHNFSGKHATSGLSSIQCLVVKCNMLTYLRRSIIIQFRKIELKGKTIVIGDAKIPTIYNLGSCGLKYGTFVLPNTKIINPNNHLSFNSFFRMNIDNFEEKK